MSTTLNIISQCRLAFTVVKSPNRLKNSEQSNLRFEKLIFVLSEFNVQYNCCYIIFDSSETNRSKKIQASIQIMHISLYPIVDFP